MCVFKKKTKFWNGALKKRVLLVEQKRRRRSKSSTDLARLFLEARQRGEGGANEGILVARSLLESSLELSDVNVLRLQ